MEATGPLVPLCERHDVELAHRATYDHVGAVRGEMGNVFKALANAPEVLGVIAGVGETLRFAGSLADDVREAVVLTVARERGCVYEWSHHWHVAERLGIDPGLLEELRGRDGETRSAPLGPALRLARLLASSAHPVPAGLLEELHAELGAAGLVELLVLIGYYRLLADAIELLRVPLEADAEAVPLPARAAGSEEADHG